MILKGQNLRILTYNSTSELWKVIGMATNCIVTLTGNTEDASHKDVVGLAAMPSIVSKGWSVQVDSLDMSDVGAILTAIKSRTTFRLMWDETATSDNQSIEHETFARQGDAFINDFTAVFNDREISTKGIQFTGTGELTAATALDSDIEEYLPVGITYGQGIRLFLGSDNTATPSKVIASAKQLTFHVSATLEDATTKDTEGDWVVQEVTAISYDISTSALVKGGDTITSAVAGQTLSDLETIYENAAPVKWEIATVGGANNRTKQVGIVSGSVVLTTLTINGPNRANADFSAQLAGYGIYNVAA